MNRFVIRHETNRISRFSTRRGSIDPIPVRPVRSDGELIPVRRAHDGPSHSLGSMSCHGADSGATSRLHSPSHELALPSPASTRPPKPARDATPARLHPRPARLHPRPARLHPRPARLHPRPARLVSPTPSSARVSPTRAFESSMSTAWRAGAEQRALTQHAHGSILVAGVGWGWGATCPCPPASPWPAPASPPCRGIRGQDQVHVQMLLSLYAVLCSACVPPLPRPRAHQPRGEERRGGVKSSLVQSSAAGGGATGPPSAHGSSSLRPRSQEMETRDRASLGGSTPRRRTLDSGSEYPKRVLRQGTPESLAYRTHPSA